MTKPPAYIGMTGLSSREEVEKVLADFDEKHWLLMIGVHASYESLNRMPLNQPKRYPPKEALADIFPATQNTLNILHINAPTEMFLETMLKGREAAANCHGSQLNITLPEPKMLEAYLGHYPDDALIISCGKKTIESVGNLPALAEKMRQYEGLARYVLVDTSGGKGIPFDIEEVKRYLEVLNPLPFGLGVAGGLDSSQLHKLHRLKSFMPFSIDAESGLRTDDIFSVRKASHYLKCAATVYNERLLTKREPPPDDEARVAI